MPTQHARGRLGRRSPIFRICILLATVMAGLLAAVADEPKDPVNRITDKIAPPVNLPPFAPGPFKLVADEVVAFTGPENMVIEQQNGWLETALAETFADLKPRFRHMGYEGDTVHRQNRMMNWGSWRQNLEAARTTTIFAWFGQIETFDETRTPEQFAEAYGKLLDQFQARTPRIVLISPLPFEKPASAHIPDNRHRNPRVKLHAEAARKLAAERKLLYVDLFTPLAERSAEAPPLTRNGMHLTQAGMREISGMILDRLGLKPPAPNETLRAAVIEKNRIWFDNWRCMNWAFAYGDRTTQPFAKPAPGFPSFNEELTRFRPLVAHGDAAIHAAALRQPPPAPLPPGPPRADPPAPTAAEQMARFNIRPGFSVNLFADEKLDVIRPIQIRWDEHGRLWALCVPSYPQLLPGQKANDFLLMLTDTDGDGKADQSTRVAENLSMPMGFEFGDGGIYVCQSTQLIHLRDTDGDGRMDASRVILSGFGTGDSHQNINSIRWGADGCLWLTQGYHIWSYVETPHGLSELNRSGIWRFNPRTHRLDSYLNESTAGLNCWGVAFDDHGQVFHASGADTAVWHTTPAIIPTLHPLSLGPGLAGSRGKSMEPEFLGSSHLPPELQGALLKSTYFTSQVQLYRLEDRGAGFASADLGDLISSKGTEFRPLETRGGPDGAIYICDWLNPVIGHYQASYRDPRRDLSHGRIWRMTANGRPLVQRTKLETMSAAQLLQQLDSPERWVRDQAKFALYRLPAAQVIPAVDALLAKPAATPASQMARLYEISGVLAAHEEPRPAVIDRLLASDDFRRRAWGVRLVGLWSAKLPEAMAILRRTAADPHPRVRMEVVVAASYLTDPLAVQVATLVMDHPMDGSINYALTQCIHALAPRWKPALAAGKLDFGDRFHALARVLTTVGDTSVTGRIHELLKSNRITGGARDSLLAVLIENGTAADVAFAVRQAPDSPVVLDALTTVAFRRQGEGYHAVLEQLLTSPFPAGRIAGCRVAATWNNAFGQMGRITALAADAKATAAERAAALLAIGRIKGAASLAELSPFAESEDPLLRAAALEAMAPHDPAGAADRAAKGLARATAIDQIAPLFNPLLGRKGGPELLAKSLAAHKPPAPAARLALQWMGQIGRDDRLVLHALYQAAGITPPKFDYSPELVKKFITDAKATGDAARGAAIFKEARSTCLACHKLGETGGTLGPDLTAIGRAMTPEAVVESLLWPRRQVKEGFLLTRLQTSDGALVDGYIRNETEKEITLNQIATGKTLILAKSRIARREDAGTLMPEGLTDWMTDPQRLDLLIYLMNLGK